MYIFIVLYDKLKDQGIIGIVGGLLIIIIIIKS